MEIVYCCQNLHYYPASKPGSTKKGCNNSFWSRWWLLYSLCSVFCYLWHKQGLSFLEGQNNLFVSWWDPYNRFLQNIPILLMFFLLNWQQSSWSLQKSIIRSISLVNSKQQAYTMIYSARSVKLKSLKIYIKTNLANNFKRPWKLSANAFISFVRKLYSSCCLFVNYRGLNNLIIKIW